MWTKLWKSKRIIGSCMSCHWPGFYFRTLGYEDASLKTCHETYKTQLFKENKFYKKLISEQKLSHVCGSDGVTYDNDCTLRKESCLTSSFISISHVGICGNINPCIDHRCNFGGVCKVVNDAPNCQCETCSDFYKPVCGTNGLTYKYETVQIFTINFELI